MTRPSGQAERIIREMSHAADDQEVIAAEFVAVRRRKPDQPLDKTIEIVDIRQIARENYIISRVSLVCGYPIAGCLVAHQSIEMYLKGLIIAYGGRRTRTHNLRQLVGVGARLGIPGLAEMSRNEDHMLMFKQLCGVYDTLRFGEEAGYVIDHKNIVLVMDEVVFSLEKMYAEKLKEENPIRLYVHETLKDRFLKFNDYFTTEFITNNSMAAATTNVKDIPELLPEVGRKVFTAVNIRARGLIGNVRIGHVPKRIPKEEQAKAVASLSAPDGTKESST